MPYLPRGVHLAVVDPRVGTARRPLALRCHDGDLLVGPDNGLLWPAAERCGGVDAGGRHRGQPAIASNRCRRPFTAATCSRPSRRAWRSRRRSRTPAARSSPEQVARLEFPEPAVRKGSHPGAGPGCGPVRERAAERRPRAHARGGLLARAMPRAWRLGGAHAGPCSRGRSPTSGGRGRALRGLEPGDRGGAQRRQRRRGAGRRIPTPRSS